MVMLKPGDDGFSTADRDHGPVVNPSYWVFEATNDGVACARRAVERPSPTAARAGRAGTADRTVAPPDWVSLAAKPAPAEGLPQEFGHNAVRIPLYMMRAGTRDWATLRPRLNNMADERGRVRIVDIELARRHTVLNDPGYRIIPACIRCVLDRPILPEDLRDFSPTEYYPSTLASAGPVLRPRREHPECL